MNTLIYAILAARTETEKISPDIAGWVFVILLILSALRSEKKEKQLAIGKWGKYGFVSFLMLLFFSFTLTFLFSKETYSLAGAIICFILVGICANKLRKIFDLRQLFMKKTINDKAMKK